MTNPSPNPTQPNVLSATYSSPSNLPFTYSHSLNLPAASSSSSSASADPSPAEKSAYLAVLRDAVKQLQESINTALTQRMEEDNARTAATAAGGAKGAIDEAKEEDNYGEEVVDDEE